MLTRLLLIVPVSRWARSPGSCLSTCQRTDAMGAQVLTVCGGRYLSRGSCLVQGWQEVLSGQGEKTRKSSCWPDSQGAWLSPGSILTLWGLRCSLSFLGLCLPHLSKEEKSLQQMFLNFFKPQNHFFKVNVIWSWICMWLGTFFKHYVFVSLFSFSVISNQRAGS